MKRSTCQYRKCLSFRRCLHLFFSLSHCVFRIALLDSLLPTSGLQMHPLSCRGAPAPSLLLALVPKHRHRKTNDVKERMNDDGYQQVAELDLDPPQVRRQNPGQQQVPRRGCLVCVRVWVRAGVLVDLKLGVIQSQGLPSRPNTRQRRHCARPPASLGLSLTRVQHRKEERRRAHPNDVAKGEVGDDGL